MRLGRWELEKLLGRGGMGEVWLARDPERGEEAAIKLLPAGSQEADQRLRFEREAQVLQRLRHPGVVSWLERGEEGGRTWVAMEVLPGGSLLEMVRRRGPLPVREAVSLARDLAAALAVVHQAGLLHRDLKPANVLFDATGGARLTDFGLALSLGEESRLTATGALMGSPGWLAPELVVGDRKEVGVATDIYGLGAILYFLLTARPPFPEGAGLAGLQAVVHAPVPIPSSLRAEVPHAVDIIATRCLAKSPADRFPSAVALRAALDGCLTRSNPRGAPNRAARLALPAVAILVGAAVCAVILLRPKEPPPPRASEAASSAASPSSLTATRAAPIPDPELERLELAARSSPEDPFALQNLATALQKAGKHPEAERAYDQVIKLAPGNPQARVGRAEMRRLRRDLAGAFEDLDLAAKASPSDPNVLLARAEAFLDIGELNKASQDCRAVIRLAPDNAMAHMRLGDALFSQGDLGGAIGEYELAVSNDPDSPEFHFALGQAYLSAGDPTRARVEIDEAIRLGNRPEAWVIRGVIRGVQGDRGGLDDIDHAIELAPERSEFRAQRGQWHFQLGEFQRALEDYEQAIALAPNAVSAWHGRAEAQRSLGQDQAALSDLDRAFTIDPHHPDVLTSRAALREKLGDLAGAEDDLVRRIELGGASPRIEQELARVRGLRGKAGQ